MKSPKLHKGIIKRHPDGFGFFIADDPTQPDAYVPAHEMQGLMTHDRVTAKVFSETRVDRFWAKIVSLDQRHWKQIVAPIQIKNQRHYFVDSEGAWGQNVLLTIPDNLKTEIKPAVLAVADITHYPDSPQGLCARVIKILGPVEQAQHDVERVARTSNIPIDFSKETILEIRKLKPKVQEKDFKGRKDLRHLDFVTIDGATAKDFDDAIYIQKSGKNYRLWVAIADVSHYVKPNTALDKDAYERGTSCYFPGAVIPMLPEILSNELCSLKPYEPRLAFVCEMLVSPSGQLRNYQFYEAVIESKARLTYGLCQEILDAPLAKKPSDLDQYIPQGLVEEWKLTFEQLFHLQPMLKTAQALGEILLKKRLNEGSLDLELPEFSVLVDAIGNPLEVIKHHRLFAHRLIEEFMLLTNQATALFFEDHQIEGIYRVHELPKAESIEQLARFARSLGIKLNPKSAELQKELRKALQSLQNSSHAEIFSNLILRSMKQAKYSAQNVGHFGLNFTHYTHFTSPIRRYPDLIAHRLIKRQLKIDKKLAAPSEEEIQTWCTWLSSTEQRAVKAERQVVAIKKARLMSSRVGESFKGVVSGVTKFGVFVTLKEYEVEGLVHIESLSSDPQSKWEFNPDFFILTEKKTGKTFSLGDELQVTLDAADLLEGKLTFSLVTHNKTVYKKAIVEKKHSTFSKNRQGMEERQESGSLFPPSISASSGPKSSSEDFPSGGILTNTQKENTSPKFDPGKKLIEALSKKGLKPSKRLLSQEGLLPQESPDRTRGATSFLKRQKGARKNKDFSRANQKHKKKRKRPFFKKR